MNVLITGATGLIGNAVLHRLARAGHSVKALVRDPARAEPLLRGAATAVRGDILEPATVAQALQGIDWLFHCAGMPEQWQRDEQIFDRVNREGTRQVLEAALAAGVKRAIYTSTMDVFGAPRGGTLVESNIDPNPKPTAYERSKQAAEKEAESIRARGLDLVYVNPAAVYGPSPVHVALNSMFLRLLNRDLPALPPGGMEVAYVDGVADAHLAAAERGASGERFLVADGFASNLDLAREILTQAGEKRSPPPVAPAWLLRIVAAASAPLARTFGFTPMVAPGQLSFMLWAVRIDASKAKRELGFQPTPLAQGVAKTIAFLREQKLVPAAPA